MKAITIPSVLIALSLFLTGCAKDDSGPSETSAITETSPITQEADKEEISNTRTEISLNGNWKFFKGDAGEIYAEEFDDSDWTWVNLPHNTTLYTAENKNGYEDISCYRKTFELDDTYADKRITLISAGGGVFLTSPFVSSESADIHAKTYVYNRSASTQQVTLCTEILYKGTAAAKNESVKEIGAGSAYTFDDTLTVSQPHLWHPYSPELYTVRSTASVGGETVDEIETTYGIRSIEWTHDGFFINGEEGVSASRQKPDKEFYGPNSQAALSTDKLPHPPITFAGANNGASELTVVGYINNAEAARYTVKAPQTAAKVGLKAESETPVCADGSEVKLIWVSIEDRNGHGK